MFGFSLSHQSKLRMKKAQAKANPLPFIKVGQKIFYDLNQIEQWLRNNQFKLEQRG